ncbi:GGDEF domain-containing protein, partial [Oxalobacteraceae bacterium OM1]
PGQRPGSLLALVNDTDQPAVRNALIDAHGGTGPVLVEARIKLSPREIWFELRVARWDSAGDDGTLLVIGRDMSAQHATEERLRHMATHDGLTGLANRALYYDRLRQSLALARRHDERLAVLYVDMDGLKPINDQFGHRAGDAALREVAERLSAGRRESDTVARVGGDEFALILPRVSDEFAVMDYAQRLAARIEGKLWTFEEQPLPLRASIGYALYPEHGGDMEILLERADQAMYQAKQRRKRQMLQ